MAINVGIVGATGLVGEVFLKLMAERKFPVGELRLFASERSKGTEIEYAGRRVTVEVPARGRFKGLDLVFFSSGDDISKEWAPVARDEGAVAVDNSGAFRMDPDIALVVPEVNADALPARGTPAIIANPNCSTIQLVLALAPLVRDFNVESVHVATYQAVSGAGTVGQDELRDQLRAWVGDQPAPAPSAFPVPIANNCVPQIGGFDTAGFCTEESKIRRETKKILGRDELRVSAFTVRVPAWNVHSEAVWVRFDEIRSREEILRSLRGQPGLHVDEGPGYPTARACDGTDPVAIGRVHRDLDDPRTFLMWIVADNLRKGAALNGIQIAERIFGA
jgi:aspartate-semialdehyde dehydrogenase